MMLFSEGRDLDQELEEKIIELDLLCRKDAKLSGQYDHDIVDISLNGSK